MGHLTRRLAMLVCATCALTLWAPGHASADEPSAAPERTALRLVSQVMTVVRAVKKPKNNATTTPCPSKEARRSRVERARERGVVPAARTVYQLLRGRLEINADNEDRRTAVRLQVRPKSAGGYVRCEFRF